MNTLDRVTELRANAKHLQDAQAAEEDVKSSEGCRKVFSEQLQRLRKLRLHAEAHKPVLQEGTEGAVDWSAQSKRLLHLRKAMGETTRFNLNEVIRPFEALVGDWKTQLEEAWRSWCAEHKLAKIPAHALRKLEEIFPDAVGKLRSIEEQRAELSNKALPGPNDVATVKAQVQATKQALDEIGFADEEVRQEFQALATGAGVDFTQLAEPRNKLRLWLGKNDLLEDCRVRLG